MSSRRARRLVVVVPAAQGCARLVGRLRRLRDQYGWTVTCLIAAPGGSLELGLRAHGIETRVHSFAPGMMPAPWRLLADVWRLARCFRQERFDVAETTLWQALLCGRLAAWLADVPVRTTFVVGTFHLEAPASRWMDTATAWMDSRLIAACESIRTMYLRSGVSPARVVVIPTGTDDAVFDPAVVTAVDLRAELGWPADTPVIAHVAWFYATLGSSRWIPDDCRDRACKGHDDLVEAMPHILRDHPTAKLVLIGAAWPGGGERTLETVRQQVRRLNLTGHVVFAGTRSDIAGVYKAVDVAVHPSLSEARGGVPESLLMARPTVATHVGGMPDLVIHNKTGLLVAPSDPASLARAISDLLRDPARGRALGLAGRAHALRLSTLTRSAGDLNAVYRDCLDQWGPRRRGYRWWVTLLRLPVVLAIVVALPRAWLAALRQLPGTTRFRRST